MTQTKKKNLIFITYFFLLLLVFISWQNYESVPGGPLRIAYLAALVLPLYSYKVTAFPAVLSLFYTIAMSGFTTSYMPTRVYTYIAVTGVAVALSMGRQHQRVPTSVLLLFLLVCLVNIVSDTSWQNVSSALLLLIMFFLIADRNYDEQSDLFTYSFIVISLVLSLYYIIIGPRFIMEYRTMEGLDRVGFTDINYGGTIVGMGAFAALVEYVRNRNLTTFRKVLIWCTIALSAFSLVMNASRGAVLSVCVAAGVLVLFANIKSSYKLLTIVILAVFVSFLYTKGYMDLLLYRIENDEIGGGSGRTEIWRIKFDSFTTQANPFEWLMGMGYTGGRHIGWGSEQRAFHNDFLAFFVDYGIAGLIVFLFFFFGPIYRMQSNKPVVIAGIAFMLITCMTLEPFTAGRLPFFVFWFYLLQLSKSSHPVTDHRNDLFLKRL